MIGLLLKFDKWSKNIFKVLFSDIDYSQWELDVFYWESFEDSQATVDPNKFAEMPSMQVKNEFFNKGSEVVPEFAKVLFRFEGLKKDEIKTYDQFIHSAYFLSLIIIDHRNIEICGKDDDLLTRIEKNFLESNLLNKRIQELSSIPLSAVLDPWRSKRDPNIYDIIRK